MAVVAVLRTTLRHNSAVTNAVLGVAHVMATALKIDGNVIACWGEARIAPILFVDQKQVIESLRSLSNSMPKSKSRVEDLKLHLLPVPLRLRLLQLQQNTNTSSSNTKWLAGRLYPKP